MLTLATILSIATLLMYVAIPLLCAPHMRLDQGHPCPTHDTYS